MSRIDYTWRPDAPPRADVYVTRINASRIHSVRYWDGQRWFDIALSQSRSRSSSTPFQWPKKPRVAIGWRKKYPLTLRKITRQDAIQWGTPYRVYDDKEVLEYLVGIGELPRDWRTIYQAQMRAADTREIKQ